MALERRRHSEGIVLPYRKIMDKDRAISQIRQWQGQGQKVVAVDGVFDLPTYHHAEYLQECANVGDKLLVRVNSDEFVASRKDPRGPIVPWQYRAMHTAFYPFVDAITPKTEGGWDWLKEYRPDIVVKSTTSGVKVMEELREINPYLQQLGVQLVLLDENFETVPLQDAIKRAGEYETNRFGNGYFSSGSVMKKEIGRRAIEDFLTEQAHVSRRTLAQI